MLKEFKKVFTIFVNYVILKKPHNYIIFIWLKGIFFLIKNVLSLLIPLTKDKIVWQQWEIHFFSAFPLGDALF